MIRRHRWRRSGGHFRLQDAAGGGPDRTDPGGARPRRWPRTYRSPAGAAHRHGRGLAAFRRRKRVHDHRARREGSRSSGVSRTGAPKPGSEPGCPRRKSVTARHRTGCATTASSRRQPQAGRDVAVGDTVPRDAFRSRFDAVMTWAVGVESGDRLDGGSRALRGIHPQLGGGRGTGLSGREGCLRIAGHAAHAGDRDPLERRIGAGRYGRRDPFMRAPPLSRFPRRCWRRVRSSLFPHLPAAQSCRIRRAAAGHREQGVHAGGGVAPSFRWHHAADRHRHHQPHRQLHGPPRRPAGDRRVFSVATCHGNWSKRANWKALPATN